MFVLVTIAFLFIVIVEMPNMIRNNLVREQNVFWFYLLLAIILTIPQILDWSVPSPNQLIEFLFWPLIERLKL